MTTQSIISRYPGTRIQHYRNSSPRYIKVVAMGANAEAAVSELVERERENVLVSERLDTQQMLPMDAPVNGIAPHAVILVHQQGETGPFPFLVERTAAMLSLIVIETAGTLNEAAENKAVRDIRAFADLFVTTSDSGFIRELVDNLAS